MAKFMNKVATEELPGLWHWQSKAFWNFGRNCEQVEVVTNWSEQTYKGIQVLLHACARSNSGLFLFFYLLHCNNMWDEMLGVRAILAASKIIWNCKTRREKTRRRFVKEVGKLDEWESGKAALLKIGVVVVFPAGPGGGFLWYIICVTWWLALHSKARNFASLQFIPPKLSITCKDML